MKRRTARDNERKISNILIAVSEIGILLVKEKIMATLSLWIFIVHHIKVQLNYTTIFGRKIVTIRANKYTSVISAITFQV